MRTRAVKDGLAVLAVILGCSAGLMIEVPPVRGGDSPPTAAKGIPPTDSDRAKQRDERGRAARPERIGPRMDRIR